MSDGYTVNPVALEHDALEFDSWSQSLDAVQKALPLSIDPLAFSVIPGGQDVRAAFQTAVEALHAYVGEGSDEFDGFARALLKAGLIYMVAEGYSSEDIARLNSELESL